MGFRGAWFLLGFRDFLYLVFGWFSVGFLKSLVALPSLAGLWDLSFWGAVSRSGPEEKSSIQCLGCFVYLFVPLLIFLLVCLFLALLFRQKKMFPKSAVPGVFLLEPPSR